MYDKDGSGTIELPEMIEIIGTLYEMEGVTRVSNTALLKLSEASGDYLPQHFSVIEVVRKHETGP